MEIKDKLLKKIEDRSAIVGVIGLGYVGLPLALEFAKAGFKVIGYDVSQKVVDSLMSGVSHIQDVSSKEMSKLVKSGQFAATTDESSLGEMDAISVAVPTPLVKTRDPDMSYVAAAGAAIARHVRPGMLVVLESTTYPGTTRELILPVLEKANLKVGEDVFLAFSPERVDPGNPHWHTKNTPKVAGGITPACLEVTVALYKMCIDTVVPVSSTETAELTKLLENTFRSVNIALANEMAMICNRLGVDVWEMINAAATKPFGFMKFTPGPGIGGHCIPLDPHYLAWKMRTLNYKTRFIELASEINSEMPVWVVEKVAKALNQAKKSINGSNVRIFGIAYKKDINDMRESPALDIIRLLEERGAKVDYYDPYVSKFQENGRVRLSIASLEEGLAKVDIAVIITDHSSVDYQKIIEQVPLVVDTRNATVGLTSSSSQVFSL